MAGPIKRTELFVKGEELLNRLNKANKQIRKLYKIKANDQIKTLARLKAAYDLMSERIANDALLLAADESPLLGLTLAEKNDRAALKRDIIDMCTISKQIRDIAGGVIQDISAENDNPNSMTDEKKSHLEAAYKMLDEVGLDDANVIQQGVPRWQEEKVQ